MDIVLKKTTEVESPPFFYLQQFYEFEFSPITKYETDKNGLYDYKKLQESWNHHHYDAYLCYLHELPIGFAVINLNSQIDQDPHTRDVADFFVMPNYRKNRVGEKMAMQLFDQYPGKWQVRQLVTAVGQQRFWRRIIDKYTQGKFTEEKYFDKKWGCELYVQNFLSNTKI